MKRQLYMIAAILLGLIVNGNLLGQEKLDGKSVFVDRKCATCHGLEVVGMAKKAPLNSKKGPPDLSTVGSELTPEFIMKFIMKEDTLNGKKHMIKFSGPDDELKVLAEWLGSLKKQEPTKDEKK